MVIISARQRKFLWPAAFSICLGRLSDVEADIKEADIKDDEIEGRLISLIRPLLPGVDCLAVAGIKQYNKVKTNMIAEAPFTLQIYLFAR